MLELNNTIISNAQEDLDLLQKYNFDNFAVVDYHGKEDENFLINCKDWQITYYKND